MGWLYTFYWKLPIWSRRDACSGRVEKSSKGSCMLYMLVSAVIVGLVPYYEMDPDTPISSAFASHGIQWAANSSIILLDPRILMAMARDDLLPSFFSKVKNRGD
ncbi:hypothetical protein L1987_52818 [Smallanthus sonchifolius]|uniref:Uncharacterized protein n=1 Tax=Smallanthus sonchifolius TaxID=185202 RepID=A0ACB9EUU0_9ASTR|nr:hypothetical protein L1987_52818 [Smallanthus sonchifolius]